MNKPHTECYTTAIDKLNFNLDYVQILGKNSVEQKGKKPCHKKNRT